MSALVPITPTSGINQLVQVYQGTIGGNPTHVVIARELHAFLEVGKVFGAWIVERIQKYDFQENQDFAVCFPNLESENRGGQNRKEYHITLDMAKELSMVENNAKGREARRYFIEMERRALSTTPALPTDSKQYNEVDALKIASIASRAAKAFGFTGNQAVISVSNAVKNITGIDPLQLMGQSHLIADQRGRTYTPTELGKMMEPPRSGRVLNKMLEAFGLIEKDVLGNWLPTTKADGLYEWLDTGKRHSDGAPVKQLKWFSETLKLIGNSEQLTSVVH